MSSEFCVNFNEAMRAQGYECNPKVGIVTGISVVATLALFIIGCLGASGAFPGGPAIGWVTVGMSVGMFALGLSLGKFKERKPYIILGGLFAATFITLGALGAAGVLSATQVGCGIIGTTIAKFTFGCILKQCKELQIRLRHQNLESD